jgi:hypothetical protein
MVQLLSSGVPAPAYLLLQLTHNSYHLRFELPGGASANMPVASCLLTKASLQVGAAAATAAPESRGFWGIPGSRVLDWGTLGRGCLLTKASLQVGCSCCHRSARIGAIRGTQCVSGRAGGQHRYNHSG